MIHRRPHTVLLITPKGTIIIARRLFERLETRMESQDLGLLRDFDWWRQLSALVNGIAFPVSEQQEAER